MNIDYEGGKLISKNMMFFGNTSDGKGFTINANWNDFDDWNVLPEDISWDDEEGSGDEVQEIIYEFLNEMNG